MARGGDRRGRRGVHPSVDPLQLLHRHPLVPGGAPLAGLLDEDLGSGRARLRLLRHVLRVALGQPVRDATPGSQGGRLDAGAGDRRTLPGEHRAIPPLGDPGRRRGPVPVRRTRGIRALARVPALAFVRRDRVRQPGAGLPPRSGLLRVHPSVAEVSAGLVVRVSRRGHRDRGDRSLPPGGSVLRRSA